jgi:hypothetical protein
MSAQRCRGLYGDFDTAVEATAADDAVDGAITAPGDDGDEAGVARQHGSKADLGLTGRGSDERCRGRPWASQTDRDSIGEGGCPGS